MLFSVLKNSTPVLSASGDDKAVTALTIDSREAGSGSVFFCIKGVNVDRALLAPAAYHAGCRAFVAEHALPLPSDAAVAIVPNARLALADMAAAFYGYPASRLTVVGVTGTKGKTTTSLMLTALLREAGVSAGYIGSLGAMAGGTTVPTVNTTPESLELQRLMAEMADIGVTHLVLEVSSQSLAVGRIRGMRFPLSILTGLGYDHVGKGEHGNLPDYFAAKRELLYYYHCKTVVYPEADREAAALLRGISAKKVPVGFGSGFACLARTSVSEKKNGRLGESFHLMADGEPYPVTLPMPGKFNVTNALLATAAYIELEKSASVPPLSVPSIARALGKVKIPGRLQCIPAPGNRIFLIDYAHNGQSMGALLQLLREYRPARLTVVFGSVGGRSFARRAELGRVVSDQADSAVITADNPGAEDPATIAAEIRAAMRIDFPAVIIPDRAAAIAYAVQNSVPGEIVAVCGKGAEDTQLIGKNALPYSDEKALTAALSACDFSVRGKKQKTF